MIESIVATILAWIMTIIAIEAITEILVTSALLDIIGLRTWATNKAMPPDGDFSKARWYHAALYKLMTCGYCTSVWMSFAAAWLLPGEWFAIYPLDNVVIKAFALHRLSNLAHVLFELMKRGRVRTYDVTLNNNEVKSNNV